MANFVIFSDSSCDLPDHEAKENDIHIIPFYVSMGDDKFLKEGLELTHKEFYRRIREEKIFPRTSLPSVQDYIDGFSGVLAAGKDILCFCLSFKFSGSGQSAINAAGILKEQYPERKIIVVDTMQVTYGQGIMVLEAARLRDEGKSLEETNAFIEALKPHTSISFTLDSLEHLQKGGRVGKASALAGSILNIKPVMIISDGEIIPHSKVRGRGKAISKIIDIMLEDVGDSASEYEFGIISADVDDEALELIETLRTKHGICVNKPICRLGVTIGTHVGPSALGILYMKRMKIYD